MPSSRRSLLIAAGLLAVIVGVMAWLRQSPPGKSADVISSQSKTQASAPLAVIPNNTSPATLQRLLAASPARPASPQHAKEGVRGIGLPEMVKQGSLIEQRDAPAQADGSFRRSLVYRTGFKYPFVRVEQMIQRTHNRDEKIASQIMMVADHLMVQVQKGTSPEKLIARLASVGATVRRHLPGTDVYLVATRSEHVADFDAALSDLERSDSAIALAEPDFIVQAVADPVIPNDPSFNQQWDMHNTGQSGGTADADIDAPEAWSVTTGSAAVVVGVIDTGMDLTHPDLAGNLWTNPGEIDGNGLDDDGNGYVDDVHGWNFVANTNSPNDDNGHGSHTCGTVGAVGGNATGISGVCQTVRLMPLKFLDASGSGTDSDALLAINYATAKGALLTSNSWGGGSFDPLLLQAIQNAGVAGVGFIAAAGNSGINADLYPEYPAAYNSANIISVAATDSNDALAWFSNFGAQSVHIGAPGLAVFSTYKNHGYATMSGTSMATPHVSGAAALLKAANSALTFAQIKSFLLEQGDLKSSLSGKTSTGRRLNVANALVPATAPLLANPVITINDSIGGNGDGIVSPGETIQLLIRISNTGATTTTAVQGTLSLTSPPSGVTQGNATASYGDVAAGATATNTTSPFEVSIDSTVTPTDVPLVLTLTDDASRSWTLNATLRIRLATSIAGTVTKLTGGTAFEGATIAITGPVNHTLITDVTGAYNVVVPNGTYTIQASATGYIPSTQLVVTVPPAKTDANFVLGFSQSSVTPLSLSSTQLEGETKTQTFTIHNNGDQTMTYNIIDVPPDEVAASSLIVSAPSSKHTAKAQLLEHSSSKMPSINRMTLKDVDARARSIRGSGALPSLTPSRTRDASDNSLCVLPFQDGFEDGMWGRWWDTGGTGVRNVVNNTAAKGTHSFHMSFDGADDHFTGVHQLFDWQNPGYISFWTRPGPEDLATSYMVLLDYYYVFDITGFHAAFFDFIWFFANANGRFYLNDDVGGNQAVVYTQGEWYHIEFRNIDWSAKKFDYYVDGQLIQAGVPFRNPAASYEMVFALTYNYSSGTEMWFDEAKFYNDALPWIRVSSKQGTVAPGDSVTITATFDATTQLAGHYTGKLQVRTNDPITPVTEIAVDMTETATANNVPVASAQSLTLGLNGTKTITLAGSDADSDPLTCRIVGLPAHGKLFQTDDGVTKTSQITNTPTVISHPQWKVIYQSETGDNGAHHGDFAFDTHDPKIASTAATIGVDITSWPLFTVTPESGPLSDPTNLVFQTSDPTAVVRLAPNGVTPDATSLTIANGGTFLIDHSLTLTGVAALGSNVSPPQLVTFQFTDSNNDGIPDWYALSHPSLSNAEADDDGDGVSNAQEFIIGTNPAQPDRIVSNVQSATSSRTITWQSMLSRIYIVESSNDLQTWSQASQPQFGTGSVMSWQDTSAATSKFYRVRVSMQ